MPNIKLIPPPLPGGVLYCPSNWQQAANDFFNGATGQLPPGGAGFWYGATSPPDPVSFPVWVRTDNFGVPVFPLVWITQNGIWVARHPIPANSNAEQIWKGVEGAALWSYEGGDGTDGIIVPATATTGPMWIVDHTADARMPLMAGTLPSGTVINELSTGGEEKHLLTAFESVPHLHPILSSITFGATPPTAPHTEGEQALQAPTVHSNTELSGGNPANLNGVNDPHNTLPPYIGRRLIMRTARVWVTSPY